MYLFLLFTLGIILVFIYYMLLPYRNIKSYEAYRIAMEGFETQVNKWLEFYLIRNRQLDTATSNDTAIENSEYKKRIKECYEYAMSKISKYRLREVLLYCSKDEIENMVLTKAETLIFDEYGDRIIQDADVLAEQESLIDITNKINRSLGHEANNILGGGGDIN